MSPTVTIVNRQRRCKLDIRSIEMLVGRVADSVIANLEKQPCQWISSGNLAAIKDRGSFSLSIVSDRKIRELNSKWRGKNRATDVLSFPYDLEPPEVGSIPFEVGELFISVDRALAQAEEYGHGFDREMAFLAAHGLLHILGFDHETSAQEKDMFGRQEAILEEAGYRRKSIHL